MNRIFIYRVYAFSFIIFVVFLTRSWATKMIESDYSYSEDNVLMNCSALLLVLVSFLWLLKRFRYIHIRGIHRICMLWILTMPVIMFLNNVRIIYYFVTILWPLCYEVGYVMTAVEKIELKQIRKIFIIVFCVGLFFFIQSKFHVGKHDQTNTIYFPFLTAPFLLCCQNKRLQLVILIGISLLGIWSFKRSVFLIVMLMWLFYTWQTIKKNRNVLAIVFTIGLILLGGLFALKRIDQISGGVLTTRAESTQDDEGGGRFEIWAVVITMIDNSSMSQKIIGHGHMGVKRDSPYELSAHNDILEVIYDYGMIILLLYVALWFYVIKNMKYYFRSNTLYSMPYFCSFSIFLIMSMVSHLILYTSYFNYLVMFWGCMEGIKEKKLLSVKSFKK